jgi:hypothetical protein
MISIAGTASHGPTHALIQHASWCGSDSVETHRRGCQHGLGRKAAPLCNRALDLSVVAGSSCACSRTIRLWKDHTANLFASRGPTEGSIPQAVCAVRSGPGRYFIALFPWLTVTRTSLRNGCSNSPGRSGGAWPSDISRWSTWRLRPLSHINLLRPGCLACPSHELWPASGGPSADEPSALTLSPGDFQRELIGSGGRLGRRSCS